MWRKKMMAAAVAGMLMASLTAFPALAHGHGYRRQASASVSVPNTASVACPVAGCGQAGYHTHDGSTYWGRYPVCTVEGCGQAGYHTHDGSTYCGYAHSDGYCDNSCWNYSGTAGSARGYHGCH